MWTQVGWTKEQLVTTGGSSTGDELEGQRFGVEGTSWGLWMTVVEMREVVRADVREEVGDG